MARKENVLNAALMPVPPYEAVHASERHSGDYHRGMRLAAAGEHAAAIGCFERALQKVPEDTRVLFALGNTAKALGLSGPAEGFYRRVLALEPARIEAVVNLANLLRAEGKYRHAETLLDAAAAQNPACAELWLTFGSTLRELGRKSEAEDHYRRALQLKPDYPAALANLADMRASAGAKEEALALYGRALARDPQNAQARLNRAVLNLLSGNLREGWRDYEARLKVKGKAPQRDHKLPKWNGSPLKRTRLLVTAEQGIGDQIMFASMIPELSARATAEGGSIVLECEPRLVSLFARSFPGISVHASDLVGVNGTVAARYGWLRAYGGANAAIEIGNLGRWLRPDLSRFPRPHAFLATDAGEREQWARYFRAGFQPPFIGVCWRSGKLGGARSLQFASLEAWATLIRALPGTVICAQYDATPDELAALEALSSRRIAVPPNLDQKQEIDRTCAMFAALDTVVSAPTAVSWMAGGVGTTTYKALYDTSWTAFGNAYEPFAPACACISPAIAGDWADTFGQIADRIRRQHSSPPVDTCPTAL